jgi:hypothetical protein
MRHGMVRRIICNRMESLQNRVNLLLRFLRMKPAYIPLNLLLYPQKEITPVGTRYELPTSSKLPTIVIARMSRA